MLDRQIGANEFRGIHAFGDDIHWVFHTPLTQECTLVDSVNRSAVYRIIPDFGFLMTKDTLLVLACSLHTSSRFH
jgi:hypothetical protein